MPILPRKKSSPWDDKLTRSAFFLGALLFHLVIFLLIATWVVFKGPAVQPDVSIHFVPPTAESQPPAPPVPPITPTVDLNANDSAPDVPRVLSSPQNSDFQIHESPIDTTANGVGEPHLPAISQPSDKGIPSDRLSKIRKFVLLYRSMDEIATNDPSATFPVYVAAYADGDWACNTQLDQNGNIVAGSIPNLVAKINEWSHGQIKGEVVPKPLNIGGTELLDKMPPFIFFTGHKDFVLTDREIENLQNYLQDGGAIWGDNAMAGVGSRFDVAFRREMKRVIPDIDKKFEPLAMDAGIFTKSRYSISQVPQGMNYYSEPLEHLDINGKLAILYTPNDYSDLYAMRILPGDTQIETGRPNRKSKSPLFTSGLFLDNQTIFFRNFTLQSSLAVHRLGMNIVTFLLTRFDNEILLNP